jgi:hypothetical protein
MARFGRCRANIVDNLAPDIEGKVFSLSQQVKEALMSRIPSGINDPGDQNPVSGLKFSHPYHSKASSIEWARSYISHSHVAVTR